MISGIDESYKFKVYSPVEYYRIVEYGGERDVLERFLEVLKPTDVFYDIGASVGLYTVIAAALLTQGEVYSFEPDPSTCTRLEENIRLNRLNNVHVVKWAVSDTQGEVVLYSDGVKGYAPSFILQNRPGAPTGQVCVPTSTLDIAISHNDLSLPDVLKIDIEGAEALCLRGSAQLLEGAFAKRPRIVFIEIHPEFLPKFGSSADEIKKMMLGFGYRILWSQKRDNQEHVCYQCQE